VPTKGEWDTIDDLGGLEHAVAYYNGVVIGPHCRFTRSQQAPIDPTHTHCGSGG
jgi:hypothetical protein